LRPQAAAGLDDGRKPIGPNRDRPGFDHQLWLILVDVMAAVFGYEEACIRDECRQILVRRTQGRFQMEPEGVRRPVSRKGRRFTTGNPYCVLSELEDLLNRGDLRRALIQAQLEITG